MEYRKNDPGRLRRSEWIGGILYWPMFLFGSQVIAILLVIKLWPSGDETVEAARINLVFGVINAVTVTAIFRRFLAEHLRRLTERGWKLFGDLILGLLSYISLVYAAAFVEEFLISALGVAYFNTNQEAVEGFVRSVPLIALVDICLLAPLTEEVLTRGLIFTGLYRKSRTLAYAVSMLVFSLAHCAAVMFDQPVGVTVISVIAYLPAGYVLAWSYERSGSIWTPIFLHAAINAVTLLLQAFLMQR